MLPIGVESAYFCFRGWAVRIFTFQQSPDHRVAPRIQEACLAAQGAFMREAKLARNSSGGCIPGITVNLDAMNTDDFKPNSNECRCGFRDESLIDMVLVDPVPNLQRTWSQTRMQARPTD